MAIETVNYLNVSNAADANANTFYGADVPALDLRNGGQWGHLPILGNETGDKAIAEWMYEQAYQKRDLICKVIALPKFLDLVPNSTEIKEAFIAMFEVHSKTIDGLNSSLTVETNEHELGLSGASFKEVSDVKRESTSVTHTWLEREGNPFEILLDFWIRYGLMDPDAKKPLITRIADENALPKKWTADWYSMTALYIEPDVLYRKPVRAFLVPNLFPVSNPEITGKKDKNAARELKEISVELGGFNIPSTNIRIFKLAEKVMSEMNLYAKNPEDLFIPNNEIDKDLTGYTGTEIYYEGIKSAK